MLTFFTFLAGLALLVIGADILVRGASQLATAFGLTPLVIGLTVVAFGTSAPELAVSIQSALNNQGDLAIGNVIGSNIFNTLFILGTCALILPLTVSNRIIRLDVPLMIVISAVAWLLAFDGRLSLWEGFVLLAIIVVYTFSQVRAGQNVQKSDDGKVTPRKIPAGAFVLILVGLVFLIWGSRWLVSSAVTMAQALGMSEIVVGLTIVAMGTSLPEVAASIMASIKGERDMAVGNIIGSNIFNLTAILGASALASGGYDIAHTAATIDFAVLLITALLCFPIFLTGFVVSRKEGAAMVALFAIYTILLILRG